MANELHPASFPTFEAYEAAFTEAVLNQAKEQAAINWRNTAKHRELAELPAKLGFKSVQDLINALLVHAEGKTKASKPRSERHARTEITDEIRNKVKELAASGKKAPSIAKELDISVGSTYNILKPKETK